MTENGQHTPTWSPASFRALRDALKRPGLVTLNLWPENPDLSVTLDLSGISALMMAGKLSNKMLTDREDAVRKSSTDLNDNPDSVSGWREITNAIMLQHDYTLGAVIVDPKYYMLDQLPPGMQPDDGLCIHDFTPEMRWAIMDVLDRGAEAFATFCEDPLRYATTLSESTTRRAAERVNAATDDTVVAEDTIQSGDLVERAITRIGDGEKGGERDRQESEDDGITKHYTTGQWIGVSSNVSSGNTETGPA